MAVQTALIHKASWPDFPLQRFQSLQLSNLSITLYNHVPIVSSPTPLLQISKNGGKKLPASQLRRYVFCLFFVNT